MDSALVWEKLGKFFAHRGVADAKKVKIDLHSSGIAIRARLGYCSAHEEIEAIDRNGRYQCWCGDSVILKAEAAKIAADGALAAMANDPTWRC